MTGFIKPEVLYQAQLHIVKMAEKEGKTVYDLPSEVQEFLKTHPVTKEKEQGTFKKVDGVFVTVQSFEEAGEMERPVDRLI